MDTTKTYRRTATAAIGTCVDWKDMSVEQQAALEKELETAKKNGAKKFAFFLPTAKESVDWSSLVIAIHALANVFFLDDRNPFRACRWSKIIGKHIRTFIIDMTFTDSGTHWRGKSCREMQEQYQFTQYDWDRPDYNGCWIDVDYAACISAFLNDSVNYDRWEECRYGDYLDEKVNPVLLSNKEYTYKR